MAMAMATAPASLSLLLLLLSLLTPPPAHSTPLYPSPYHSPPTVLFPDYRKMTTHFKIYTYDPPNPFHFTTPSETQFHNSLLNSQFLTRNPNEAHLFFVPFPNDFSTRPLSRLIRDLRRSFPYWNRTLGADHFFVSRAGIAYAPDRNVLELKKNAVQISVFPTTSGNFIPHKDLTLPPIHPNPSPHAPANKTASFLGFSKLDMKIQSQSQSETSLVQEMEGDPEFKIASEPLDFGESRFCLFLYGGDLTWVGEAMRVGCVPVVITDRPIHDLPMIDVVRWSEIAVFVGPRGGVGELKRFLSGIDEERYERMRRLGIAAAQHFVWNATPQPLDAFHMVMYQLWLRRHAIRYARREWV
ncbi:Glycosyltransferase [Actinidia chinensis var. chinensis]|uniref:Glycosyltransferase n=1 Tax=Actinidia chinensis var. chinensis TaxID=1590841 RepID=A0A2R6RRA8_ACTCC|nr:Glycosyltransferase [Actinidia chinensis var. chinensis]